MATFKQIFQYQIVQNSLIMKLLIIIECPIVIHNLLQLYQYAALLSCTIMATYQLFHCGLNELNRKFYKIILDNKKRRKQKSINQNELRQLQFIYRQHNRLSYYELLTNKQTWSHSLYYFTIISLPINITFICELIFEDLSIQIQLLFISIIIIHMLTGLLPFLTLANVSNDFHRIRNYILPMQPLLKCGQHLRMKIKYDCLYERLMFGKKIAYTIGHLAEITFTGLVEAFLHYFVAFFLIIGFYMKEQK